MIKKIILIITIIITSSASQIEPTVINISFKNKDNYPYVIGEGKAILSVNPGVAIDTIHSIEKKLNIKFIVSRDSWLRQKRKLQYNKIDMLFSASYKKSRKNIGIYPTYENGLLNDTKKIISSSYVVYKLKESKLDWDGKVFSNLTGKLITQKGYSIVSFLKNKGVDALENRTDTDIENLLAKRVEGVARHSDTYDQYFKLNPKIAEKIVKLPIPLKSKGYYLLASKEFYKNNPSLVNKIWDELSNIDKSNKFKYIRDKY